MIASGAGGAPVNYFDVRWADGYGHVSDAGGSLAIAIEEACETVAVQPDGAPTLATRRIGAGDGVRAVGLIRLDVVTSSGPRTLQYVHAVALPAGYPLDDAAWARLVTRRYGDDPAARIRAAYEQMAATTKEDGRALLAPFTFERADVEAELGSAPGAGAATPTSSKKVPAAPAPTTRPPRAKGGASALDDSAGLLGASAIVAADAPLVVAATTPPRSERSVVRIAIDEAVVGERAQRVGIARWASAALGLMVVALIVVAATRRCSPADDVRGPAPEVSALRARVEELEADRTRMRTDLEARAGALQACETKLAGGAESELRRALDAALAEAATTKAALDLAVRERDRVRADHAKLTATVDEAGRAARQLQADLDHARTRSTSQDALIGRLRAYMADECRRLRSTSCLVGIPK